MKYFMKRFFLLLQAFILCLISISAEEFYVDGIKYYINSDGESVNVCYGRLPIDGFIYIGPSYDISGGLSIPEKVSYNGKTYLVTGIDYRAFYNCYELTSINIPKTVSSIEKEIFYGCSKLANIIVDSDNTHYDSRDNCNAIINTSSNTLIAGCMNTIIPNSISAIGDHAYYNCPGLTNVNIPNSVTKIGKDAFSSCSGLSSITIGNSVTLISDEAFSGCSALTSVTIPNSVTKIGYRAFSPCTRITTVNCHNTTPPYIENGTFGVDSCCVLYVPANSIDKYKNAQYWKNFKYIFALDTIWATSITLNKTSLTLNDDQSETLEATIMPYYTTNKIVTWKSSNTSIATVDANGKVTGVGPGAATIIATTSDGTNLSATCQVTVFMTAKSVTINKTSLILKDGLSETLVATVLPENTTNKNVTWRSSNTATATVDANGKVTGMDTGTATITATTADGTNLSASCSVTVITTAKSITLNKNTLTLNDGQSETLVATVSPNNANNKNVTWRSSNSAIAKVDAAGKVTGVGPGTATITVTTADGTMLSDSCTVTVKMLAKGISLNIETLSLNDGQNKLLVATVTPDNTSNKVVTWESSNNNVATVNANGLVTAVDAGNATITATTSDGTNHFATCQVTVVMTAKAISIDKTAITLNDGQSERLVATVFPNNTTNKNVIWKSSDVAIATVDAYGNVTGIAPGMTTITATTTDGTNLSATSQITVLMTAKSISFNKTSLTLNDGQSEMLVATVLPENTTNKEVIWQTNNSSIAIVDSNGNVTGINPGTATVYAKTTDGTNLMARCTVYITKGAEGISLNKSELTLDVDKRATLYATVTPSNAANKSVTWSSSNPDIASVDNSGNVTAINVGTAEIHATTTDGTNLSDVCLVTVVAKKLYADTTNFFGGDEVEIAIKMKNTIDISGFQTDIQLPSGMTFVTDSDGYPEIYLSDRATRSHTIGITYLSNTKVRILSYSSTNRLFSGNDGELFSLKIKTKQDASIQDYSVVLSSTELAGPDGSKYNIENTNVILRCYYVPGDANHDNKVSISDIVSEARYILLENPDPFHYKSANVNEDNTISVSDIVLTANIILGRLNPEIRFSLPRMLGNDVMTASMVDSSKDGCCTIAIALDNSTKFTAFQADLCLPEGMEMTGARLTDRAGRSHSVAINRIGGNIVRVLSYATDNATFDGCSGDLLLIDVKGRGNIEMTNTLFCGPNGCEYELDEITFSTELSGINDITVGNGPINVYNMAGQLLRKNVDTNTATQGLPAGIYLVGNKKVVVK